MAPKNIICLWLDSTALETANFYAATFPDSVVGVINRAPSDYPNGKQGDVLTVEFTVVGFPCFGLNGGPAFKRNVPSRFRSRPTTKLQPTGYGTLSSAIGDRKALVAGAKTGGVCRGKSRRARLDFGDIGC